MGLVNAAGFKHPEVCYEPLHWIGEDIYNTRKIVCAANKYTLIDGREVILPCVRHGSKELHNNLDLLKEAGLLKTGFCKPDDQGFIDQYSNWWSREDAYVIATAANQVNVVRNGADNELYSEGLY